MLPLQGMGVEFALIESVGPVIARPVRAAEDVRRLRNLGGDEYAPEVIAAVRQVAAASPVPVICFSGAPFTLASYLIEGKPTRDFNLTKRFMYSEPEVFAELLGKLGEMASGYLAAQIRAGAAAVQLFDSWVGALDPTDYAQRALPHTRAIFSALAPLGVPRIHFGTGTAGLLELIATSGCDVVSLDWRVPLDTGWERVGRRLGVQGNLDPAALLAPADVLRTKALDVLDAAAGQPGHIFNLGHGVLPETPLENLQRLVATVHEAARPQARVGHGSIVSG
jgi:uroporphyrinogen decarboxylase